MKNMKKVIMLLVAAVMLLAMTATAFAADTTITAPANEHKYEVYQIITGTYDATSKKLSDMEWGADAVKTGKVSEEDAAALSAITGTEAQIAAAVKAYAAVDGSPAYVIDTDRSVTVPYGYYLIIDKGPVGANEDYSLNIVQVAGAITITPKAGSVEFNKKVKDTNDTTGDTSDWQDSADHDLGDAVPFKLTGKVASDYATYDEYYFAFHDVEETGLTFDSTSVNVYVDGNKITEGYQVVTAPEDGCTFEVVFADLKKVAAVQASSVITVEYTSVLNENAVMGSQGNVNKAKLEYSNRSGDEQKGKGETDWDNVIVFTYNVVINKVDQDNKPLTGAEFTLEKVLADGSKTTVAVVKNEAGTSFTFNRLDDGDYVLTETQTPVGYNSIDPITFTVTADHKIEWTTAARTDVLESLSGSAESGAITLTATKEEGSLTADVINKSGSTLPTTGGIGTTIFYVAGVIMVIGAGVLLVTKKRMAN